MKVESIIISNKAMISTQAISLALENNIDLVFLDRYGFPIGRVWFSKMGSTALIRRKQLDARIETKFLIQYQTMISLFALFQILIQRS
jgi:CRISPR-associated protein Cas1